MVQDRFQMGVSGDQVSREEQYDCSGTRRVDEGFGASTVLTYPLSNSVAKGHSWKAWKAFDGGKGAHMFAADSIATLCPNGLSMWEL